MKVSFEILYIIASYLLGSVMFGAVLYRLLEGKKIRDKNLPGGSGSIRRMGLVRGILVGLLDITKVFLPVYFGIILNFGFLTISGVALAGIIGHNWPIFYKFKGGLGLSSIIGGLSLLIPREIGLGIATGLITGFVFTKLGWIKKMNMEPPSVGAIFGLILVLILAICWHEPVEYISLAIALIIISLSKSGYRFIQEHRKS